MFNFILTFGIAGIFCLALITIYVLFVVFMYIVYRCDNGKMSFREYIKYW